MVNFSNSIEHVLTSFVFDVFSLRLGSTSVKDYQYQAELHDVVLNLIFKIRIQKVFQLKLLLWLYQLGCLRVLV